MCVLPGLITSGQLASSPGSLLPWRAWGQDKANRTIKVEQKSKQAKFVSEESNGGCESNIIRAREEISREYNMYIDRIIVCGL